MLKLILLLLGLLLIGCSPATGGYDNVHPIPSSQCVYIDFKDESEEYPEGIYCPARVAE